MYRRGWEAWNASSGVYGCQGKRGSAQEDELRIEGHAGEGFIGNSSKPASWQLSTGELIPTHCNTIACGTCSKQQVLIEIMLSRIISTLTKCKSSHRAQHTKSLLKGAMVHTGECQRIRESGPRGRRGGLAWWVRKSPCQLIRKGRVQRRYSLRTNLAWHPECIRIGIHDCTAYPLSKQGIHEDIDVKMPL